jgi:hypothetical protein
VQQNKLLNAFAGVNLPRVKVALRVGHDLMHPVKLACVAAVVSGLADNGTVIAAQCPDHIVLAISDKQIFLILVNGKRELLDGSSA